MLFSRVLIEYKILCTDGLIECKILYRVEDSITKSQRLYRARGSTLRGVKGWVKVGEGWRARVGLIPSFIYIFSM
jgi:hypothetical protein